MKILSLLAVMLTLGFTLAASDAEAARRLGGGKSAGMQRQVTTPDKAPAAAPAQAPTAAAASAKSPAAAAAPQAQPGRSWMGPLAGLAAGLGLAALASHFGFGAELASMLMIGLLVMAVMVVIGLIMRRRAASRQPAMAGAGGLQYAASGVEHTAPVARSYEPAMPGSGASATARNIPADFDVPGFVRNAKVHFIRLQAANDAGNLDDIREFTTPEMFAELKMNIAERGGASQETDVVAIDADVIEVAEEANRYVVSVRFSGQVREERNGPLEAVDEIWHLVKPREGAGGWLLAGIQQIQ
ncbi:Tim44 domain-containing protein [Sulfurisoma sediminicola]|uniref:Putative lipid-binding transport protein (Tim44 family) n=1 Tax=Sulfurisoma sediminicola TaxID=1381557 RepID=A0A497X7A5_9PROT|nr:Tim44-like domain-containing protein [Sulfurisoma sediminicola]RLJ61621.1 putative lipid-binding transport protein (Tim44 family) [Sulfurisoma sediminicola]